MARITVEDCLTRENNRFALVQLAAKRSKQILHGNKALISDARSNKAIVTALREIAAGKVRFMNEEEARIARELAEQEREAAREASEREQAARAAAAERSAASQAAALGASLFAAKPAAAADDDDDDDDDDDVETPPEPTNGNQNGTP